MSDAMKEPREAMAHLLTFSYERSNGKIGYTMYVTNQSVHEFLVEFMKRGYVQAGRYCLVNVQALPDKESAEAIRSIVENY